MKNVKHMAEVMAGILAIMLWIFGAVHVYEAFQGVSKDKFGGCSRVNYSIDESGMMSSSIYGWHHYLCWQKDDDAQSKEEMAKYNAEIEKKRDYLYKLRDQLPTCDYGSYAVKITMTDEMKNVVSVTNECLRLPKKYR